MVTLAWYREVAHVLAEPGRTLCGRKTKRGWVYRKEWQLSDTEDNQYDILPCQQCEHIRCEGSGLMPGKYIWKVRQYGEYKPEEQAWDELIQSEGLMFGEWCIDPAMCKGNSHKDVDVQLVFAGAVIE